MTRLEAVLLAVVFLGALWAWDNRVAIAAIATHPGLVSAGSDVAAGLAGLGVIS